MPFVLLAYTMLPLQVSNMHHMPASVACTRTTSAVKIIMMSRLLGHCWQLLFCRSFRICTPLKCSLELVTQMRFPVGSPSAPAATAFAALHVIRESQAPAGVRCVCIVMHSFHS